MRVSVSPECLFKNISHFKRSERDMIKNFFWLPSDVPLLLSGLSETLIFSTVSKNPQISNFVKICPVGVEF